MPKDYATPPSVPPTRDFILKYGVKASRLGEYLLTCPLCKVAGKLSCNVNIGVYKCWRGCCSGKLPSNTIKGIDGVLVSPSQKEEEEKEKKVVKIDRFSLLKPTIEAQYVNQYLLKRRVTREIIEAFELEGAALLNSFAVAFRVITPFGPTDYWGYRLLNHPNLRYYTDFPKDVIYGHPRILKEKAVLVMEGVFDLLSSLPFQTVSLFGKKPTDKQKSYLEDLPCEYLILCLDGSVDKAYVTGLYLQMLIRTKKKLKVLEIPGKKDPGDLGPSILNYPLRSI